jgi:flagellar biosynthesis activator protein FlaF
MLKAVRLNWQLWTIIQSELLAPDCPVPMDIRQNVLSLANFIDKHTVGFIGKPVPSKLDVLISINRELAGGLYLVPEAGLGEPDTAVQQPSEGASLPPSTDTSA